MSKDITLKVQPSITVDAQVISDETAILQVIDGAPGPPGPKFPSDVPSRTAVLNISIAYYEISADDIGKMILVSYSGEEAVQIDIPDGLTATVGDRIECVNLHTGSSPDMYFVPGPNSTISTAAGKADAFRAQLSHATLTYVGEYGGFDTWYLHGDLADE